MTKSIPSIAEYAQELKQCINFPSFFAMCRNTASNLNSPCDRFIKGNLREEGLDVFSLGRLERVDEEGRDNRDKILKIDIEFKTTTLFTEKGRPKRNISVRLKNTMGNNATGSIKNPAHFYIFGDYDGLAICDYLTMEPYLEKTYDALIVKIPFDKLTPICFAKDITVDINTIIENTTDVDYIGMRIEMHKKFMSKFIV